MDVAQPRRRRSSSSGCARGTTSHGIRRRKVRFYGLDLYSLRASIEAVIAYLDRVDPAEARRARERYSCFDHVGGEGQAYGYALAFEGAIPCENEVVAQLDRAAPPVARPTSAATDGSPRTSCSSPSRTRVLVRDAEEYYQQMYRAEVSSWNLRDRHMAGTLDALVDHLDRQFGHAKVVVWEHNSHVGDARATAMGARGELNVGQLARQRYGDDCAARRLHHLSTVGSPRRRTGAVPPSASACARRCREATRRCCTTSPSPLLARHRMTAPLGDVLRPARLERAIGVIYRPETERQSHYFDARLADQFDAVIHLDRTRALEPLERTAVWDRGEPPETFPTGM